MEKTLMFRSASEVRLSRVLRFMIPTYLTSLFNTVYTMVDGILSRLMWGRTHWRQSILFIRSSTC